MKSNKHYKQIDVLTLDAVAKSLSAIQEAIAHLVTPLTPKKRHDLPKMGEKTLAFVKKCYEFAEANPGLRPPYLNMDEFRTDYMDAQGLFSAVNIAGQLKQNLADTQICSGSEAYQCALSFYNFVKLSVDNGVPGAGTVYEELRKRFPNRSRRTGPVGDTVPQD